MHRHATSCLLALLAAIAPRLTAQQPGPPAATRSPSVAISGVLFPQFIYGGTKGARSENRFELERAYLTAQASISDRTSVRLTADVYRPSAGASYTMRAKYAYVEYAYWTNGQGVRGTNAHARLGMQPTVIIEVEDDYWPRWISQVAVERAGYFSSSDLGASTTFTLPGGAELFGMVSNGTGYTTPENDRFKDWSLRLTFAPFGSTGGLGLVVSPWLYKGARESTIVPDVGRTKDRAGIFAAVRTPVVVVGGHLATANNESETGTPAAVDTQDRRSTVLSVYTHLKPLAMLDPKAGTAWGLILRWDRIESDAGYVPSGGAFPVEDGRFVIAGVTHDLNERLSWALDYQQQSPRGASPATLDLRTYNLHAVVRF